MEDGTTRGIKM